ncbi:hypothetical protein [Streptomyces sp. NPDC005538]|uniref:hypothetical protein n=1 Tax=unclassified Streptomyces TaxID=2593676 RepID=UPI0033A62013
MSIPLPRIPERTHPRTLFEVGTGIDLDRDARTGALRVGIATASAVLGAFDRR